VNILKKICSGINCQFLIEKLSTNVKKSLKIRGRVQQKGQIQGATVLSAEVKSKCAFYAARPAQ